MDLMVQRTWSSSDITRYFCFDLPGSTVKCLSLLNFSAMALIFFKLQGDAESHFQTLGGRGIERLTEPISLLRSKSKYGE